MRLDGNTCEGSCICKDWRARIHAECAILTLVFTDCRQQRWNEPKGGQCLKVKVRLIYVRITCVQHYNTMAIRMNTTSIQEMKQDVLAIWVWYSHSPCLYVKAKPCKKKWLGALPHQSGVTESLNYGIYKWYYWKDKKLTHMGNAVWK
jgi:hypothetical protein